MNDFEALFQALADGEVEYILVGGVAATVHGSVRLTQVVDVVYARSRENHERLVSALATHAPYLRGAPPDLPFDWSVRTMERGYNFALMTELGALDLFAEIPGAGTYERLVPGAVQIEIFGRRVLCIGLDDLILAKRASGRPKDNETLAELEALREEREGRVEG